MRPSSGMVLGSRYKLTDRIAIGGICLLYTSDAADDIALV